MWSEGAVALDRPIRFHTRSGLLTASRSGEFIELDFPSTPAEACEPPLGLLDAIDVQPTFVGKSTFDFLLVVESADAVRSLQPDYRRLAEIPTRGVIVTAQSDDHQFDFVSRFFAPAAGVDEDPVTGSAHCCLAPFWSDRLGTTEMTGFQTSSRGGIVRVRVAGDRVILGGQGVTVFKGELV